MKYWVERWAEIRYKEMVLYSKDFPINSVYFSVGSGEELRSGFDELFNILKQIYKDCSLNAEKMLLPKHEIDKFRYLSKEERISRVASNKYGIVLYTLGCTGKLNNNGELCLNIQDLKEQCKEMHVTGIERCLNILEHYGFIFQGLKNGKIRNEKEIIMQYSCNENVLKVLHILAAKAKNTNQIRAFCRLNYRLLKDNWNTADFGKGVDFVADVLPMQNQEVASLIHEELVKRNYSFSFNEWNEGPQIRYYKNETDYIRKSNAVFYLASIYTEMRFYFRVRDIEKGLVLIKNAPESVIQNMLVSDQGCQNRFSGRCLAGLSYELEGRQIWRCGCCNPNFQVVPTREDYMFYIDLAEETYNKRGKKK